ncbi:hypothetical protein GRI62_11865 [Erythrobacter arachoides]|uniref:Uncharacterized protein n=1 Tax=Aurantiacibacter arachoides TaxID=1850444 RepID=A0A845A4D8_9SPHN|nr:hypothetical protein [Aurantiacibacter arachoides]MXO94292.1 hypothetical protein [Aurantiacibacter arachoides]GGD64603.1 hypothetical protein GCM10011411_26160 [Aurantiacibacter arachoides]
MAFLDRMEALKDRFVNSDKFTDATITRTSGAATYDPIVGKTVTTSATIPCRAVLGTIEVENDRGAIVEKTAVTVNVAIKAGDVITIGTTTVTIGTVKTTAPHGTAILWKGVAK